eukprot:m.663718 g.663718  ORF g.663718 m.663718 type:complete len:77 (-) comp22744_c0_seq12:2908-3138(-)
MILCFGTVLRSGGRSLPLNDMVRSRYAIHESCDDNLPLADDLLHSKRPLLNMLFSARPLFYNASESGYYQQQQLWC